MQAFDDPDCPYLPREVLWRQKEQFSDGVGYRDIDVDIIDIDVDTLKVGYSWIDHLKLEADKLVTDLQMKFAESR